MAQLDSATLIPAQGYVLTAPTGTARPTAAALGTFVTAGTLPATWVSLGHTDLDNILTFGTEGGDTTIKGSWQTASLREIQTSKAVDYYTVRSLQALDRAVLALYYGGGDATTSDEFALPDASAPTERASLLVLVDGVSVVGFYNSKASIRRDGAMEFASDDFTKIPLRFTPLKNGTNPLGVWYSTDLV